MANETKQAARDQGARPRILRIGVLLGGKIVEERLIRERVNVSLGQSMRNTFSIPVEGLPLEHTLFSLENNAYQLRFLGKMDGRLSEGDRVETLEQLKTSRATKTDAYWSVPLQDTARGKLSVGDLTILFQFVTEPPRQPRPMLPASVRGSLADRIDPRLSAVMGASIVAHAAIVIVAMTTDVKSEGGMAERAYNLTFTQEEYKVEVEKPKVEVPQQSADKGSAATDKPDKPKATPTKQAETPSAAEARKAEQQRQQEDNARVMADLLTGEGAEGTSEGDMSTRRPGADLGTQIAAVREGDMTVAVGGGDRGPRGDGDLRLGTGKERGPVIAGPTGPESAGGGKQEKGPAGRIQVSDKQTFDDSTLTPDVVLSKIQSAYMAGLKRCYKEHLKTDPSARGKITLSLTVNETGRTTQGAAKGFASEVDDCISGQMTSWRFPVPKDKDGEPTEASFAITLQLVPD